MFDDSNKYSDEMLEIQIESIQAEIEKWAKARELWHDCGFTSYLEHVDGEPPDIPIITILTCGGDLYYVLSGEDSMGYEVEFSKLLDKLGCHYEHANAHSMEIYVDDEVLAAAFKKYFHWQWVCSLIKEDTADVYEELYSHFAQRPDDLHRLHWREFEVLLFRIFQSQGFDVELGPGRGDEGVDLRVWQRNPLGDILTLVQAKRNSAKNKINQTQVAALYGVSTVEHADKALFVTTSTYLPVAKRFATRTSGVLTLAEKNDVVKWCGNASEGVIADKSSLVNPQSAKKIISEVANNCDSRVVHTTWGYDMIHNNFALVIKETKHAALLMGLRNRTISDDGYGQRGYEVPVLDESTISCLIPELVWRAKRKVQDCQISYWDGNRLYTPWNGKPAYFDYMD